MNKIPKEQQLSNIQHTARCVRGCIDTSWDCLYWGEDFPQKRELMKELYNLIDLAKNLEQKAFDLREENNNA